MRFKIDNNLKAIAAAIPGQNDLDSFSSSLCNAFIDAGMIEMSKANFDIPVLQATGPHYVSDIHAVLAGFLYKDEGHSVPAYVFDAFCKLVIVSDGCPDCGGELEYICTEGHEINDGDYYTPNSYVIDKYIYQCRECGKTIKSDNEL